MIHTYPPIPDVWGLTIPAQKAEAMAASTEEPCLLSTSMPSAVQRAASVTTAPRWKICRERRAVVPRKGCWGCPHLCPALWDLKPEASIKSEPDLHFQVPPNAGGSNMSIVNVGGSNMFLYEGSCCHPACVMKSWPSPEPSFNSR